MRILRVGAKKYYHLSNAGVKLLEYLQKNIIHVPAASVSAPVASINLGRNIYAITEKITQSNKSTRNTAAEPMKKKTSCNAGSTTHGQTNTLDVGLHKGVHIAVDRKLLSKMERKASAVSTSKMLDEAFLLQENRSNQEMPERMLGRR